MPYYKPKKSIIDSIQKIGTFNTTGHVANRLTVSDGNVGAARLFIQGVDANRFPAYPDTVARDSLADIVRLGNLAVTELHEVNIDYYDEMGNQLYLYEGLVPHGHPLVIDPKINTDKYYFDDSMKIDQIVNEDVNLSILVPFNDGTVEVVDVKVVWTNTANEVLDTHIRKSVVGRTIRISPKNVDEVLYDTSTAALMVTVEQPIDETIVLMKWCNVQLTYADDDDHVVLDTYTTRVPENTLVTYSPKVDNNLYVVESFSQVVTDNVIRTIYLPDVVVEVVCKLLDVVGNVIKQYTYRGEVGTRVVYDVEDVPYYEKTANAYEVVFLTNHDNTYQVYKAIEKAITVKCVDDNGDDVYTVGVRVGMIGEVNVTIPNIDGYQRDVEALIVNWNTDLVYTVQCYSKIYTVTVNLTNDSGDVLHSQNVVGVVGTVFNITPPPVYDYEANASVIVVTLTKDVAQANQYNVVAYGEICTITLVVLDDEGTRISSNVYSGVYGTSVDVYHDDLDGYETINSKTTLLFNRENDDATITIENYICIHYITIQHMYAYSATDDLARYQVGIDTDDDGQINERLQTVVRCKRNAEYTVDIDDVDGYTKKFDTYTFKATDDIVDTTIQVITHIRRFYHNYKLQDCSGNVVIESAEVETSYNASISFRINEIEGYRVSSLIKEDTAHTNVITVQLQNNDKVDLVRSLVTTVVPYAYCTNKFAVNIGAITIRSTPTTNDTYCYLWYNKGDWVDDVEVRIQVSDTNIDKRFSICGEFGLADLLLHSAGSDTWLDLSSKIVTLTFTDNSEEPKSYQYEYIVSSLYKEKEYYDSPSSASKTRIWYIGPDYTVYGIQAVNHTPTNGNLIARLDSTTNAPSTLLAKHSTDPKIADMIPSLGGSCVMLSSDQIYDKFVYGVLDMASSINDVSSIDSDSVRLVDAGGLKFRVPYASTTILDEVSYDSVGRLIPSLDSSVWKTIEDDSGTSIDVNINAPVYVVALLACKIIDGVEHYDVISNSVKSRSLVDYDLSIPLEEVNLTISTFAPIAIATSGILTTHSGIKINAGLILMPNVTEVLQTDTAVASLMVSNRLSLFGKEGDTNIKMLDKASPFTLNESLYYKVVGEIPQIEQVEIEVVLQS